MSTDEFILKAREIHGWRYGYDKADYVNSRTRVEIFCNKCGKYFRQTPNHHLSGQGCPECGGRKKLTRERFVEKAREVHGDKYDYSSVDYVNAHECVEIACKLHKKAFRMRPYAHLNGQGCPECGRKAANLKESKTAEQFVEDARRVHGEKYGYEEAEYVASSRKVVIMCPFHGRFLMTPNNHLSGQGCPKCKSSKMESSVMRELERRGIEYACQKRFEWSGRQSMDIYVEGCQTVIECQGIQHFEPTDFAGKGKEWAENLFAKTLENDKEKLRQCREHGIRIIYYSDKKEYDEFLGEKVWHDMEEMIREATRKF